MAAQKLAGDCGSLTKHVCKGPWIANKLPKHSDMPGPPQCQQTQMFQTAMLACLSKVCSLLFVDFAQDLDGHRLHPTSDPSIHLQENNMEKSTPLGIMRHPVCKSRVGVYSLRHDSLSVATPCHNYVIDCLDFMQM